MNVEAALRAAYTTELPNSRGNEAALTFRIACFKALLTEAGVEPVRIVSSYRLRFERGVSVIFYGGSFGRLFYVEVETDRAPWIAFCSLMSAARLLHEKLR